MHRQTDAHRQAGDVGDGDAMVCPQGNVQVGWCLLAKPVFGGTQLNTPTSPTPQPRTHNKCLPTKCSTLQVA